MNQRFPNFLSTYLKLDSENSDISYCKKLQRQVSEFSGLPLSSCQDVASQVYFTCIKLLSKKNPKHSSFSSTCYLIFLRIAWDCIFSEPIKEFPHTRRYFVIFCSLVNFVSFFWSEKCGILVKIKHAPSLENLEVGLGEEYFSSSPPISC